MSEEEITKDVDVRPSSIVLWSALVAPATAFAIDLGLRYALVQWACLSHNEWVLIAISVITLIIALLGAVVGGLELNRAEPGAQRVRFMALSALILGAAFSLAIIANDVPHLFLRACE